MYDVYFKYKLKYPKEVVLIKCGTFYIAINEDAFILHKIFGYKLNEIKHGTKIGFPIASLGKVESCLYAHHIGYVVIDKENVERKKFDEIVMTLIVKIWSSFCAINKESSIFMMN